MFLHVSSKKKLVFSLKIRSSDWFSEKKIHSKKRVSKLENFWMRSEFLESFQNMSEFMSIALVFKKNLWNRKFKSSSCHTNAYFFQKWEKSLRNWVTLFSEWIIFFRSQHSFFCNESHCFGPKIVKSYFTVFFNFLSLCRLEQVSRTSTFILRFDTCSVSILAAVLICFITAWPPTNMSSSRALAV